MRHGRVAMAIGVALTWPEASVPLRLQELRSSKAAEMEEQLEQLWRRRAPPDARLVRWGVSIGALDSTLLVSILIVYLKHLNSICKRFFVLSFTLLISRAAVRAGFCVRTWQ